MQSSTTTQPVDEIEKKLYTLSDIYDEKKTGSPEEISTLIIGLLADAGVRRTHQTADISVDYGDATKIVFKCALLKRIKPSEAAGIIYDEIKKTL